MPAAELEKFTVGSVIGIIEYNDANLRISRFYWSGVPAGFELYVVVHDELDPVYPDPVFEGTFVDAGETPIAGGYRAVEVADPVDGELVYSIPPNIRVQTELRSTG